MLTPHILLRALLLRRLCITGSNPYSFAKMLREFKGWRFDRLRLIYFSVVRFVLAAGGVMTLVRQGSLTKLKADGVVVPTFGMLGMYSPGHSLLRALLLRMIKRDQVRGVRGVRRCCSPSY